ncbi:hypothetical protein BH10ACI1_BH10ACI1_32630 [soil metagenome]
MFRKNYFTFLLVTVLFLVSGIVAVAQTAPISGRVELTKADGTKVPAAGALVEIFRVDQKIKLPSDKTDKKGTFAFAGILLGGKYVLAVSGEGIAPAILPNISPGMDKIVIPVTEGNGKRWTEEEVRQSLTSPTNTNTTTTTTTTTVSEEDKKKEEEIKKQNEKIAADADRIKKSNEIAQKSLDEGDKAFKAGNFDLAIAKFEEGFNAKPTYVPSATLFLNNLAVSLNRRAVVSYKAMQADKTLQAEQKASVMESVKNDSKKAIESSDKSLELLKTAVPKDEAQKTSFEKTKYEALRNRKEGFYLMIRTGADRSQGKEAIIAFEEYLAAETDVAEKEKAQLVFADILMDVNEMDRAFAEYEKILQTNPNNMEALAGAGFTMVNIAYNNNEDKAKFQLAANYLQKFFDAAPNTHPRKADAKSALDTIKKDYKIVPKK